MVRATAALLLLLRDAEAAYIAVVGPTGDDVIVTDLTPVRLQLNDDESYGLLYEDGELLTELPHKNWVATHFPPCHEPPISRETAANVALKRPRAGAVTLTSLKCDGSAPDDYDVARIASVADATDAAGCEDATGAGAKLAGVVDAHVLVEADRFHDGTPRAGAEFWRDVAADWASPGAAPVLNLTVRTWPPEAGEDDGDLHDRGEASRNGVLEALRAFGPALGLEATDVVVVSDVDEIPNRETVRRLKVAAECDKRRIARGLLPVLATPASLLMSHHHYALEWTLGGRWAGPFAARLADLLGATAEGDAFEGGAAVFPAEFGVGEARYVLCYVALQSADDWERPVRAADMFPGRDKSGFVGPGLVADWQPRSLFDNAGWHLSYFPRAPPAAEVDEPGRLRLVAASLERKLAHHGHREFSDELLRCAGLLDFERDAASGGRGGVREIPGGKSPPPRPVGATPPWATASRRSSSGAARTARRTRARTSTLARRVPSQWTAPYAPRGPAPRGLPAWHRAPPVDVVEYEISVDGADRDYRLRACAFANDRGRAGRGSTRERNSQLQRLISRPFSTRFG
ncbi:hypothetical protein JL722_13974 [Aureococcus anophagefferens]|nr:hypothetical protein JL722_13974 [Aureococcus anophagefferens]